jgi:putative peptidoglycan lipid II flippase
MIVALLLGEFWPGAVPAVDRVTYGAVAGSALQFFVQLPAVFSLLGSITPNWPRRTLELEQVVKNFLPVLTSRGVVQLSAYLDGIWSSFLGPQIVAGIAYAQQLYLLPVSLFGMAISAAELPELSRVTGSDEERKETLRSKIRNNSQRLGFFIIPSAIALILLGKPIVALIYQTGRFGSDEVRMVSLLCGVSAVGLLANTRGRLFATAFYALSKGQVPLHAALVRLLLGTLIGFAVVLPLKSKFGYSEILAGALLSGVSASTAWLEFALLKSRLIREIGQFPPGAWIYDLKMVMISTASGILALKAYDQILSEIPFWGGLIVCGIYGLTFGLAAVLLRVTEAEAILSAALRRLKIR